MIQILLLTFSVSLDAFSVSVAQGSSNQKSILKSALITSIFFGVFQAIMPLIGYFMGKKSEVIVMGVDHWVAFILLSLIGIRMIIKALKKNKEKITNKLNYKNILLLAIATSIDALVIGITFAFVETPIITASILFGIITFIMSLAGFLLGKKLKNVIGKKIEILGGIILILIGLKILLEHL